MVPSGESVRRVSPPPVPPGWVLVHSQNVPSSSLSKPDVAMHGGSPPTTPVHDPDGVRVLPPTLSVRLPEKSKLNVGVGTDAAADEEPTSSAAPSATVERKAPARFGYLNMGQHE